MKEALRLTCQDWYRVRRGEDELAWGRTHTREGLPHILFSRRSQQELAFLAAEQQAAVMGLLQRLLASTFEEQTDSIHCGGERRMVNWNELRLVMRRAPSGEQIHLLTIRGGKVVDPENAGPAPRQRS